MNTFSFIYEKTNNPSEKTQLSDHYEHIEVREKVFTFPSVLQPLFDALSESDEPWTYFIEDFCEQNEWTCDIYGNGIDISSYDDDGKEIFDVSVSIIDEIIETKKVKNFQLIPMLTHCIPTQGGTYLARQKEKYAYFHVNGVFIREETRQGFWMEALTTWEVNPTEKVLYWPDFLIWNF